MTLLYTQGFEGFPRTGEDRTDFDIEFNFHDTVDASSAGITTGRIVGVAGWVDDGSNTNCAFRLPSGALSQEDTWITGFAFYVDYGYLHGADASILLGFIAPDGTTMCSLRAGTGTITIRTGGAGGTFIGNISANVLARTWYYLEVKVKFGPAVEPADGTEGNITVHLNEEEVYENLNCDTQGGAPTTFPSEVHFGQAGANVGCLIDDLYICDDAGASQNDFLGDVRLEVLDPVGTGATAQFTAFPDTGEDNYEDVYEQDADNDVSYVESNTAAQQDTYEFGDLTTTPIKIEAVSVKTYCKKTDGGSRTFKHVAIGDASVTPATATSAAVYASAGSWRHLQSHFVVDPDTGVAWTEAGVNDAEFGFVIDT